MYNILDVFGIKSKVKGPSLMYFHLKILKGFPLTMAERVQRLMRLSDAELARALAISVSTLRRIKKERRRLSSNSSNRLYRLASVIALAVKVLESEEAARNWIIRPQPGLGGRKPLELIETYAGKEEVENLLGRMEHGVYS
ncbi:MAG: DUF2384 domain-containing protein [Nitrospiraceae bacterium]|nr:DUF2384 domain-containing protein [Nitrospiraceae bacterium]